MGVPRGTLLFGACMLASCNAITGASDLASTDDELGGTSSSGASSSGTSSSGASSSGASSSGTSGSSGSSGASSSGASSSSTSSTGGFPFPDGSFFPDVWGAPDGASTPTKRVFASSMTFTGDLGGLAGADAKCTQLGASIGGAWVAWLSTNAIPAKDRVTGAGPWSLVGENSVAVMKAQLTKAPLSRAIRRDETGAIIDGFTWTATSGSGVFLDDDCVDWTSASSTERAATGDTMSMGPQWTAARPGMCQVANRIYCFQL